MKGFPFVIRISINGSYFGLELRIPILVQGCPFVLGLRVKGIPFFCRFKGFPVGLE